ncbi:tyrosine-type recombinase/integrase [Ruegeria arenilitoris]|uniref:tyrosine-type recombinase/integrase n=1 Tax=Ruegeria arenilitoris TaxID=1173585 RepID=UPI00147F2CCE|nr:tyrosine-type recombinase/integrase [Ruegeria arenilitoris]
MPQIKFTDTAIRTLAVEKTTWFSDKSCKGLRLCVTPTGTKTWYVTRWDSNAQKTRSVKLAQWAAKGAHTAWAKRQVGKASLDIQEGNVRTRNEQAIAVQEAGIPTFRGALDQYIDHRTSERASGKARMLEPTAKSYRGAFENHLSKWGDVLVSELPVLEINQYLNQLQIEHPHAAQRASTIAGAVVRFVNRLCALTLPIPALLDNTQMKSRVQTGRLDMQIPWIDRKREIDAIENEHIRLCWLVTWYTGFRGRSLRSLKWDQVDRDRGLVTFKRLKRQETSRTIAIADDVVRLFDRLWEIKYPDCDYVFPSRRIVGDERGHLDDLDRMTLTAAGDLRHLWMSVAREVCPRHVHRWLAQQTMTDDDLRMLGHYGEPSHEEQKAGADAIASGVNRQFSKTPETVVELATKHA